MSVFNLYNEIEQELHFLLPKRGMMLIVFHLYHRMKEQEMERTFTEEDIKKSIRAVRVHLKTEQCEITSLGFIKFFVKDTEFWGVTNNN